MLKYKEINAGFLLKYKDLRIFLLKVTFCLRQIDYSNSGLYNRFCFTSFISICFLQKYDFFFIYSIICVDIFYFTKKK